MSGKWMSDTSLLYTKEGRKWLEQWCAMTTLRGEAALWLKRLAAARETTPDDRCPDN